MIRHVGGKLGHARGVARMVGVRSGWQGWSERILPPRSHHPQGDPFGPSECLAFPAPFNFSVRFPLPAFRFTPIFLTLLSCLGGLEPFHASLLLSPRIQEVRMYALGRRLSGFLPLAFAGLLGGCSSDVAPRQASGAQDAVLFEGARLIVGEGTVVENASFLVEGNRFAQVGRAGEVQAPTGARRVDLTGKTVMPAIIDLHSHVGYERVADGSQLKENYTRENLIDHLERYAYTGHAITVSLGSDPDEDWVWSMRQESETVDFTGARFETVGRGLAWPGTGPTVDARNDTPYAIFTPWMAEVAVRELARHDVPFIKLWIEDRGGFQIPGEGGPFILNKDITRAAIAEAHRLGIRTMAHVKTIPELKDLMRNGLDMATHPIADGPADEELLQMLRARPDFWYIPVHTPATGGGAGLRVAGERPEWLDDPLLQAIKCPAFLESWGEQFERSDRGSSEDGGWGGRNAKTFYEAGVKIAFGSHDAGGNRILGWGSHTELESFVNWMGMSPHEAIIAATSSSAEVLRRNDLGSVTPGKSADFIVLDADPLDDIRNTRRISEVYLRGQEVDRPALAAKWRAECAAAENRG